MKVKIGLSLLVFVFCLSSFMTGGRAEDYVPASKRYTIDVPNGWSHRDNTSDEFSVVYIVNPKESNGMKIMVTPYSPEEGESIDEYLKRRIDHMVNKVGVREDGKVFRTEDTYLNEVPAKHIVFQMMTPSGLQQGSQTLFIHEGNQYMITYGSSDLEEKAQMDEILTTFRFRNGVESDPSSPQDFGDSTRSKPEFSGRLENSEDK